MTESDSGKKPLFKKILVANRGEIAVRILQTLQEMGIRTVALASTPDRNAEHVRMADEVIHLPGEKPADTYLQGTTIIAEALACGVDAVHPGYGFLSENADFARACQAAGIVFIGPSPTVIHEMGDKIIAKERMAKAGVPVVPGWAGNVTEVATLTQAAETIGYPVLVKAAAGGGGKGMRRVDRPEDLQSALAASAREAQNAFGDARVFLEKYIVRPRHIEFQILGDSHGNVVHLFERECSIQRRHQKIIEETPSTALTPELREQMGTAAVKAAQAMHYTNAGTVEFIFGQGGEFYFLEVNTRLQVEHPITEMTTHQDLVRLQVQVAAGQALPFTQSDLRQDGHAIECRIYAEDPSRNFMPAIGKLSVYRPPVGPSIRLDGGVREGSEVTVHYDPMLSKLIVWGPDRTAALEKMSWALRHYAVLGVTHNIEFLRQIIDHPAFQRGETHTHFLEEHPLINPVLSTDSQKAVQDSVLAQLAAALFAKDTPDSRRTAHARTIAHSSSGTEDTLQVSPWALAGQWRQSQ